jgi:imidazolonepropionase-like amidohydrolase
MGLTKRETIAAATTNFEKAFGWKNGVIKKGYTANILVLNKNPLEDLDHLKDIEFLLLNGEIIDTAQLLN